MQTWNQRIISSEHEQHFKNLFELHQLSLHWINEASYLNDSISFPIQNLRPEIRENLWMFPYLISEQTENHENLTFNLTEILPYLLDDTSTEDTLSRIEENVLVFQATLLKFMYDQTPESQHLDLEKHLEQVAWNLGKKTAESRWDLLTQSGQEDLRKILLALHDSPLSGYPKNLGFLVKRSTSSEIFIELKSCPHQSQYSEVKLVEDQLCSIYSSWMKGFGHAFNHQLNIEHIIRLPRCVQRWSI